MFNIVQVYIPVRVFLLQQTVQRRLFNKNLQNNVRWTVWFTLLCSSHCCAWTSSVSGIFFPIVELIGICESWVFAGTRVSLTAQGRIPVNTGWQLHWQNVCLTVLSTALPWSAKKDFDESSRLGIYVEVFLALRTRFWASYNAGGRTIANVWKRADDFLKREMKQGFHTKTWLFGVCIKLLNPNDLLLGCSIFVKVLTVCFTRFAKSCWLSNGSIFKVKRTKYISHYGQTKNWK